MNVFKLELVTPDSYKLLENVRAVSGKSELGDFTLLANHEKFVINTVPCVITIRIEKDVYQKFFVSSGVIKIEPAIYCIIADIIKNVKDIDDSFLKSCTQDNIIKKILVNQKD